MKYRDPNLSADDTIDEADRPAVAEVCEEYGNCDDEFPRKHLTVSAVKAYGPADKKQFFASFGSTVIIGILAHLFAITNMVLSNDAVRYFEGYGAGLRSGRWGIEILNKFMDMFWGTWNVPAYILIFAIVFLGIASYFIVRTLDIKSPFLCIAFSAVFITFPSVGSTFLYTYTSGVYAVSVLTMVLAVHVADRFKYGVIISLILGAFSISIYQGYFPLGAGLFMTLLIQSALRDNIDLVHLLLKGIKYFCTLVGMLVVYLIVLHLMLAFGDVNLTSYQGIDQMGQLPLDQIPEIISKIYKKTFMLVPDNELVNTWAVAVSLIVLGILSLGICGYMIFIKRDNIFRQQKGLLLLLLLIYPIGVNAIYLMCYDSHVHLLMRYSAVVMYLIPIILADMMIKSTKGKENIIADKLRVAVACLMCVISLNFAMQTSAVYAGVFYGTKQAENFWTTVVVRVEEQKGFDTSMPWVFIGSPEESLIRNPWSKLPFTLTTGAHFSSRFSWKTIFNHQMGYDVPTVSRSERYAFRERREVRDMPIYPNDGSIKIIDNCIIVKFEDD